MPPFAEICLFFRHLEVKDPSNLTKGCPLAILGAACPERVLELYDLLYGRAR